MSTQTHPGDGSTPSQTPLAQAQAAQSASAHPSTEHPAYAQRPPGTWVGAAAAVAALIGFLCLAVVVTAGLMEVVISPVFMLAGMILLPIAFVLMGAVLVVSIVRRTRIG